MNMFWKMGDGNWTGKIIPKSLQWPCSIHSISISLSSEIFFFHNYHQPMTTNHYKTPEYNLLQEWICISENGNLSWLTNDTRTLTSSVTAEQSPTVLSRINSRRQKGTLCGRKDFHGTMDMLIVSCLSSVQFCYFVSSLFFKIWNTLVECGFLCYCLRFPFLHPLLFFIFLFK